MRILLLFFTVLLIGCQDNNSINMEDVKNPISAELSSIALNNEGSTSSVNSSIYAIESNLHTHAFPVDFLPGLQIDIPNSTYINYDPGGYSLEFKNEDGSYLGSVLINEIIQDSAKYPFEKYIFAYENCMQYVQYNIVKTLLESGVSLVEINYDCESDYMKSYILKAIDNLNGTYYLLQVTQKNFEMIEPYLFTLGTVE